MTETIKTTAPVSSVGADGAQPYVKKSNEIIANPQRQINLQAAEKSTARLSPAVRQRKARENPGGAAAFIQCP